MAYIKDNPQGYWFKRKLYGWGWTPAKPVGFAVIAGYLLSVVGLVWYFETHGSVEADPMRFIAFFVVLTILFLVITWRTGEPPKWQWGDPHKTDEE